MSETDIEVIDSVVDDAPDLVSIAHGGWGHVLRRDSIIGISYVTQPDGKMTAQVHLSGGQSLHWGPEEAPDMEATVRLLFTGEVPGGDEDDDKENEAS